MRLKKDISIKNVTKSYDGVQVLKNIDLDIKDGEIFSILGPSGCGKTTLLRMIAGFTEPDGGAIYLGDEDITKLPPNKRNVNTIFQKYALFPHLTVYENVAFPLRLKKIDDATIDSEVKKFVKSYSEAAKMINEAPDQYKDYIFEMANIPEILKSSYRLPYYSIASVTERQLFDKMQNWMIQKKLLTQTKDYSSSIDSRFIDIVGEENDSVK